MTAFYEANIEPLPWFPLMGNLRNTSPLRGADRQPRYSSNYKW